MDPSPTFSSSMTPPTFASRREVPRQKGPGPTANGGRRCAASSRPAPSPVVLDIMMPGEDGLALPHAPRDGDTPVILLTAMAEDTTGSSGSRSAPTTTSPPFNPRELLARIRAVLRRSQAPPAAGSEQDARPLRPLDPRHRPARARRRGRGRKSRSTAEFRPHRVSPAPGDRSREQLLDLTAGRSLEPFERSIDNQVSRLRKKIEAVPKADHHQTVWGGGYVLAAEVRNGG